MTNYPIKCSKKPPIFSGGKGGGEKERGECSGEGGRKGGRRWERGRELRKNLVFYKPL